MTNRGRRKPRKLKSDAEVLREWVAWWGSRQDPLPEDQELCTAITNLLSQVETFRTERDKARESSDTLRDTLDGVALLLTRQLEGPYGPTPASPRENLRRAKVALSKTRRFSPPSPYQPQPQRGKKAVVIGRPCREGFHDWCFNRDYDECDCQCECHD